MTRIVVICEGQTEEGFVRDVLADHFAGLNLWIAAQTMETSPGHRGGAVNYRRFKEAVVETLSQSSRPYVTSLIDLYRLHPDFPGHEQAGCIPDLKRILDLLEQSIVQDISATIPGATQRFIPYIQPHEFEALLFADIEAIIAHDPAWKLALEPLRQARAIAESPEHINDRPETKPAALLERHLRHPSFRKKLHGPQIAGNIGLHRIEAECRFFAAWVSRLRSLAPAT